MKILFAFLLTVSLCLPGETFARAGSSRSQPSRSHQVKQSHAKPIDNKTYKAIVKIHRSTKAAGVARDSKGRIKRSAAAKRAFMNQTGYPNGRPGYIVDHIIALKRGGQDDPRNMQWQTISEAKAKDKIE
jgi:hypothetical protein